MRRVLNGLFAVLVAMNLLLVFSGSATASFALINRVMSVTPLLFLSATTFYENRFEFYDLVVKRGALLLAGVLLLGGAFALLLPWLDGLPQGASRPWLFALTDRAAAAGGAVAGRHAGPGARSRLVRPPLHAGLGGDLGAGVAADRHRRSLAPRRRRSQPEGRARRHGAAGHRAAAGRARHARRLRGRGHAPPIRACGSASRRCRASGCCSART